MYVCFHVCGPPDLVFFVRIGYKRHLLQIRISNLIIVFHGSYLQVYISERCINVLVLFIAPLIDLSLNPSASGDRLMSPTQKCVGGGGGGMWEIFHI